MRRRDPSHLLVAALAAVGSAWAAGSPGSVEFFRGKMAFEAGRWKDAGNAFAAAGKAGYPSRDVHYWMGKTYQQMDRGEFAQKHFLAARQSGLASHDLGFQLARIYFAYRKYPEALAELDRLPTSYQRMGEVALMRGSILLDRKEYDEAYELLKKAVQDFPYKVHSASGFFPELQSLSLADMAQQRIKDLEDGAALGSTEDVSAAPEPPAERPRIGGLTRFGSEAAFAEKSRGTETYKMHGYDSREGRGQNEGAAIIKGSRNWGKASMGANGGS